MSLSLSVNGKWNTDRVEFGFRWRLISVSTKQLKVDFKSVSICNGSAARLSLFSRQGPRFCSDSAGSFTMELISRALVHWEQLPNSIQPVWRARLQHFYTQQWSTEPTRTGMKNLLMTHFTKVIIYLWLCSLIVISTIDWGLDRGKIYKHKWRLGSRYGKFSAPYRSYSSWSRCVCVQVLLEAL